MALRGYSKKNRKSRRTRRSGRRRGFGLVRHSRKKIARDYWKRYHSNTPIVVDKTVHVRVQIRRTTRPTNMGRSAGYWAIACVGGAKGTRGRLWKKCGGDAFGKTPTIAMKKALVGLGRNPRVK